MASPKKQAVHLPQSFHVLNKAFCFSNRDHERWWNSTAQMFAVMMEKANYDIHVQYKFLCIYRELVIPALGPYPEKDQSMQWKSHLTRFGLPLELSFNYSRSLLRFTFEPLGPHTGTPEDPFNTKAIGPVLQAFKALIPQLDLQWFDHFRRALVVSDEEARSLHDASPPLPVFKTQSMLGVDLSPSGDMILKGYIYPRMKSIAAATPKEKLMLDAIKAADSQGRLLTPLSILKELMAERAPSLMSHFISCDLLNPADSRIKVYCVERQLSLASIEGIWTLNGRRADPETLEGLRALRELWKVWPVTEGLCPLPDCFYEPRTSPHEQLPFMVNFTLSPNSLLPEPQIYFPAFGHSDKSVAEGLVTFFERKGWGGLAERYPADLATF